MTKSEALDNWRSIPANMPILPHFLPIPYKTKGSKYGTCGIRIDGTPDFVNAVLSHLKELIDGENDNTRLGLARNPVKDLDGHDFSNRENGAEVCYIRLHERGEQMQLANALRRAYSRK